MTDFGRVLTAMATPFDTDLRVDLNGAQKLARHLVQSGSDALVVAGTTGESPTLTHQEKLDLFAAVKQAVGNQVKVIAGTGTNDTTKTLELSIEAAKLGVDGLMLVTPYYNKPSQEGLYQHFLTVAKQVDIPIMMYNVPPRTSINLLPATVARLARIDNIVALKEAAGSMDQLSEIMQAVPPEFVVYSGDDSLTLPMLAIGARGVVSVISHVAGQRLQEMVGAYASGDVAKARAIHLELFPLFRVLFITANPVPVKKALNLMGLPAGGVRLPLVEATPQETEQIQAVLQQLHYL